MAIGVDICFEYIFEKLGINEVTPLLLLWWFPILVHDNLVFKLFGTRRRKQSRYHIMSVLPVKVRSLHCSYLLLNPSLRVLVGSSRSYLVKVVSFKNVVLLGIRI